MTYGEALSFVNEYLRGDNSSPQVAPVHFKMATLDVALRCAPDELIVDWTGSETDVFRLLPPEDADTPPTKYIKNPTIPDPIDNDAELPIGKGLEMAIVFFICSYFTNKSSEKYESKAERVISIYTSNVLP